MKTSRFLPYLIALAAGPAIMGLAILLLKQAPVPDGEYHWSTLFRNNFGWSVIFLQMVIAFVLGLRSRANAFLIGICLVAYLPVTAIWEATVYKGSHNMIPLELGMYLLYALPGMLAAFVGSRFAKRIDKGSRQGTTTP